jgi:hypothetical protein
VRAGVRINQQQKLKLSPVAANLKEANVKSSFPLATTN